MLIQIACPKCKKSFALPDDALGAKALCPSCDHFFALNTSAIDGIAPGVPQCPNISHIASSIQEGDPTTSSSYSPHDGDSDLPRSVKRGSIAVLGTLGLRFSSPFAWLGAIVLFFLPWIEMRCTDQANRKTHITASGAQLVVGESTDLIAQERPAEKRGVEWTARRIIASCLLSGYAATLLVAAIAKLLLPVFFPGVFTRFEWVGVIIFCLLLSGVWIILENPLHPPGLAVFFMQYTVWYYASYLANLWAIISLAIEWWIFRQ